MTHALEVQRLALVYAEARLEAAVVPRLAGSWAGPAHDVYARRLAELAALVSTARAAVTEARQHTERALRLGVDGGR